jgi:hypothetical protein
MPYRIFVDLATPPDVLELLQQGTRGHQLLFPHKPISSVLAEPGQDPQFATAEIAGSSGSTSAHQVSHDMTIPSSGR